MTKPAPTPENAQRTANALEYPCGCTATPAGSVPTYCPDHGIDHTELVRLHRKVQTMADRISDLETAIRGVVDCTEEPDGACRCIQIAQSILEKK